MAPANDTTAFFGDPAHPVVSAALQRYGEMSGYRHVVCKGELGCYGAVEEYWYKLRQLKVCIWFT